MHLVNSNAVALVGPLLVQARNRLQNIEGRLKDQSVRSLLSENKPLLKKEREKQEEPAEAAAEEEAEREETEEAEREETVSLEGSAVGVC